MAMSEARCNECGVAPGEFHTPGCDVERCGCGNGGQQALSCDVCAHDHERYMANRLPWTGHWPGVLECRHHGLWCRDMVEGIPSPSPVETLNARQMGKHVRFHVPCGPDDVGAHEDINRWHSMGCPPAPMALR